jgi:hypothetical protein
MNRTKVGICLAVSCAAAWALVNAYHVEPKTAAMSGWTRLPPHPSYYISQTITCNFDSLKRVELFVGEPGAGGGYQLLVQTMPGQFEIATGQADNPGSHRWADFNLNITAPESIVKGKTYELKFTRSGSDRERTGGRTRLDFA